MKSIEHYAIYDDTKQEKERKKYSIFLKKRMKDFQKKTKTLKKGDFFYLRQIKAVNFSMYQKYSQGYPLPTTKSDYSFCLIVDRAPDFMRVLNQDLGEYMMIKPEHLEHILLKEEYEALTKLENEVPNSI
jgi:hypothetical protein